MSEPLHWGVRRKDGSVHLSRPVEVPWSCKKTGDCCRMPLTVVMTQKERALLDAKHLMARRPLVWQRFESDPDRFVQLEARPCPFLSDQNTCLVYDSRPYNCRRFMCGRVDPVQESFEQDPATGQCLNFVDRIGTSLRFREHYASVQRRHGREWAEGHGWRDKPKPGEGIQL